MANQPFRLLIVVFLAALGVYAATDAAAQGRTGGEVAESPSTGGDFSLTDHQGRQFRLDQQRGRVLLLFFGYTSCPDACPTTLAKLSKVYQLLGADRDRVTTLFVSVDPGRDTPRALKDYLSYFHLNALGLTGSRQEIDAVVQRYGARYEIEKSDSAAGYHVNHSTDLYLIDQEGRLQHRFKYGDGPQTIADGVRQLFR